MPFAVIAFDFDPSLRVGDGAVRWETLVVAAAIFLALGLAAIGARTLAMRQDDLLFVVLGVVPGAVVGGRLGDVLLHSAFYLAEPGRIVDPGIGSLELAGAVVGGTLTGALVGALLDGAVGRWLHVATLPLLMGIAVGKLGMLAGGRGQGQPWDGQWATAYLGPGPWGSLAPATPSHPAQLYEALATMVVVVVVLILFAVPGLRRPDGRAFALGVGLWALGRAIVASTWRDPALLGPLNAGQVLCLAIVAGALAGVVILVARERPAAEGPGTE